MFEVLLNEADGSPADMVQEWGRKKFTFENENSWIIPKLEDIQYSSERNNSSFKTILLRHGLFFGHKKIPQSSYHL